MRSCARSKVAATKATRSPERFPIPAGFGASAENHPTDSSAVNHLFKCRESPSVRWESDPLHCGREPVGRRRREVVGLELRNAVAKYRLRRAL
jgi:hypothetical protein